MVRVAGQMKLLKSATLPIKTAQILEKTKLRSAVTAAR